MFIIKQIWIQDRHLTVKGEVTVSVMVVTEPHYRVKIPSVKCVQITSAFGKISFIFCFIYCISCCLSRIFGLNYCREGTADALGIVWVLLYIEVKRLNEYKQMLLVLSTDVSY